MISVALAIICGTVLNLLIRLTASQYTYNAPFFLLIIECLKMMVCATGMQCISRESHFKIRWGFLVNAILYAVVNTLIHLISSIVPVALYNALIQHKLLWVVILSVVILEKTFTLQQYASVCAVLFGCLLIKFSDTSSEISELGVILIVMQGICSSLSSVWIEKMMKLEDRPKVSEDNAKQKLYWYLYDSFQMYMFGIPIYIVGSYTQHATSNLPLNLASLLILLSVVQGLSLGAIFVYYSSVVRSMVAAVIILLLSIEKGVYTWNVVLGITMILSGAVSYSGVRSLSDIYISKNRENI